MTDPDRFGPSTLHDDHCVTCGDVAVPVRVVRLMERGFAICVDRTGRQEMIAIEFTPDAGQGDVLLVHGGVAIGVDRQNDPLSGCMADEGASARRAGDAVDEHEREGAST